MTRSVLPKSTVLTRCSRTLRVLSGSTNLTLTLTDFSLFLTKKIIFFLIFLTKLETRLSLFLSDWPWLKFEIQNLGRMSGKDIDEELSLRNL